MPPARAARSNAEGAARDAEPEARPRDDREFDDQLVAEALDYAFFVASARATRAKNAAASEKNAAALSQAPGASSFAEAARAALDSLELRADITETSGLKDAFVGDHPVLESLRAWMLERSAVADAVAEPRDVSHRRRRDGARLVRAVWANSVRARHRRRAFRRGEAEERKNQG